MKQITINHGTKILAQGTEEDMKSGKIIFVEGNYYFDKSLINFEHLQMHGKGQQYFCPIKQSSCDYYNIVENNQIIETDVSWIYETITNGMFKDIAGKMAFYSNKVTTQGV